MLLQTHAQFYVQLACVSAVSCAARSGARSATRPGLPRNSFQSLTDGAHGNGSLESGESEDEQSAKGSLDPRILEAIKRAVKEVLGSQLERIDQALTQLVELNQRMATVEKAMQATSDRLEAAISTLLPSITAHVSQLAEGLARRQLELEVHRRM